MATSLDFALHKATLIDVGDLSYTQTCVRYLALIWLECQSLILEKYNAALMVNQHC